MDWFLYGLCVWTAERKQSTYNTRVLHYEAKSCTGIEYLVACVVPFAKMKVQKVPGLKDMVALVLLRVPGHRFCCPCGLCLCTAAWNQLDQHIFDLAVRQWCMCLCLCRNFEHKSSWNVLMTVLVVSANVRFVTSKLIFIYKYTFSQIKLVYVDTNCSCFNDWRLYFLS